MERAPKARTTPLDRDEEAAWRAIARAVLVVPRTLDADLLAGCGLSLAEYIVLVNLSEAPGNSMRMHELAVESTLSPSGVTRLIERMERQGLVEREQAAAGEAGESPRGAHAPHDFARDLVAVPEERLAEPAGREVDAAEGDAERKARRDEREDDGRRGFHSRLLIAD